MPRALVTGAGGTFGYHIAEGLVRAGFETLCVVRDHAKGQALLARLAVALAASGAAAAGASAGVASYASAPSSPAGGSTGVARAIVCDLASRESIASCLAAALDGTDGAAGNASSSSPPPPLDVLVNNAAYVPEAREETAEGVEAQFAVNVLAYARVWRAALPALRRAPAPRAVLVASHYAGGLDLADAEFRRRRYDATAAYRASKQANRMLARAWAAAEPRVLVASCHPGVADSGVARGLGASFDRGEAAARSGAATPLFLATAPADALAAAPSGAFWSDRRPAQCAFAKDAAAIAALASLVEAFDAQPGAKARTMASEL